MIYRTIWNTKTGTFVAVSEHAKTAGKESARGTGRLLLNALSASVMLAFGASAYALPAGGVVAEGSAAISNGAGTTTIRQSTQNAVLNWQSFNIAQGESVQFVQPNAGSVALNRVIGADPSSILGSLSANGKVFLVNPNGILFGQGASVNVGGLVASTLNITDSNFMAGNYIFAGTGDGKILNQGAINADGGYVALLGANVSNQGIISARLGTVALAAGNAVTLDVAGDGLLNIVVNQGAVNALVDNAGLIKADGGRVLMTTQAAGNLLQSVVNNSGVIQAQTIAHRNGTILLLGDMRSGTVNMSGTLDASAPAGGNGGFIEASAARVKIQPGARVTTAASIGLTGTFLIDPDDFTIGSGVNDNINGNDLGALLVTNSVIIATAPGITGPATGTPPVTNLFTSNIGNGDINVNEAVVWSASSNPTTLTLNAARDVNINAAITPTKGNLVVCCGRDVNVNATITLKSGSALLSAGRNVNLNQASAAVVATPATPAKPATPGAVMTATDGNIMMCAAENINVSGAITVTDGSTISTESLGLPRGLTLNAGYGATGAGVGGGTVIFAPLTPPVTVTNVPVVINYNPVSYTAPTDFSGNFIAGTVLTQRMLVFAAGGDKAFDGTTTANLAGLKGNPLGVTLIAGPGSTANFETSATGPNKSITYMGYSLGGTNANDFALAMNCCGPVMARTSADITPAAPAIPPPVAVAPPVVAAPIAAIAPPAADFPMALTRPAVVAPVAAPYTLASLLAPVIALTVVPAAMPNVAVVDEPRAAPAEAIAPAPAPAAKTQVPYVAPKRQPRQGRG
jgi:filamentous hemagglutinin family protein